MSTEIETEKSPKELIVERALAAMPSPEFATAPLERRANWVFPEHPIEVTINALARKKTKDKDYLYVDIVGMDYKGRMLVGNLLEPLEALGVPEEHAKTACKSFEFLKELKLKISHSGELDENGRPLLSGNTLEIIL